MTSENGPVEDLTDANGWGPAAGVAVVTGASSGIGLAAAVELARRGWAVALQGRDADRLADAAAQVRAAAGSGGPGVEAYRCDFAVLDEVRELGATLRKAYPRIAVLANNAGGTVFTRQSTVDGFEATIQSNHLASFLLSHELRDSLRGGRIINTSSRVHLQGRIDPADLGGANQTFRPMTAYASAKQANILFALEATKRWPDILSTSFHPGVVRTRFGNGNGLFEFFYRWSPGLRSPAHGARTLVWLATVDGDRIEPGGYYVDEKLRRPAPKATDTRLASELWTASAAAVGV